MTLMIDLRHIWNVIYNARSNNRHHPPTSPNTPPATQKCTPKSKRNSPRTAEASIPMRGRFDHDPNMIRTWTRHLAPARSPRLLFALRRRIFYWKLQHFALRLSTQISPNTAPATKSGTPRSPNTAPATQNHSHDWCPSHMTRHLQCAEQQISSSNITKCCACHAKWLASSILVTYETLFTMRGATSITFQVHQMLRLPRKMTLMIDVRHIWNVISTARSNKHHPPNSPNTAPATQNCIPKSKRNLSENSWSVNSNARPIRTWSEPDPNMIRAWTRHLAPARSPRLLFALRRRILYWKLQHFALRLSTLSPNTAPATKSDTPTSPNTAPATKSDTPTSPNAAPATKSDSPTSPNTAPATKSETVTELLLNWAVTELLLSCYWAVTELLLNCYWYWTVTELLLNWPVTELLLSCYWTVTELLLNCYWTVTQLLLNWPVTELLLNWAVTQLLLDCYWTVTELTCYWAVTELLLNWYWYWTVTELLLNWAVTELLLNWTVTGLSLNCYWTDLLLNWAVTQLLLNWPVTELSCYSTVTELFLNCYWTDLLLSCYWTVTELLLCTATWTVTVLDSLHF